MSGSERPASRETEYPRSPEEAVARGRYSWMPAELRLPWARYISAQVAAKRAGVAFVSPISKKQLAAIERYNESCWQSLQSELEPAATVDDYIKSMLPPDAAARDFHASWLASNAKRQLTSSELREFYLAHCKETHRIPTPENQLRKHLRKLGVVRNKSDGRAHGKRYRPTIWTLSDRQMRLAA